MKELSQLLLWCSLWALGGIWLVRTAFNLRRHEQLLTGIGLGLALQTWLANLISRFVTAPFAFWLAAGLVFVAGLTFSLAFYRSLRSLLDIPIRPLQLLGLFLLSYILFSVGRGLAILDDYQNLPMTSILATGAIPPHFALDPAVDFNYHYTTLFFSAQVMRIGDLFVWTALDLTRGFGTALALILGGLFIRRFTRSSFFGFLAVIINLFGSGARWGLLLLPVSLLKRISPTITLIGSSAGLGPDLISVLTGGFPIESGAEWSFPFAYMSGMISPTVWVFQAGEGAISSLTGALLMLTYNQWRGWRGGALTTLMLSVLAISSEVSFIAFCGGLTLVGLVYIIRKRRFIPTSLGKWFLVAIFAGLISLIQGGVITGIFRDTINSLFFPGLTAGSYFTGGFQFHWPPALLSSHLGYLELTNPLHLLVLFFETNAVLLVGLPVAVILAFKAFRSGHWFLIFGFAWSILAILLAFIQYTGSAGPTALTRVQNGLISLSVVGFAYLPFIAVKRGEIFRILVGCAVLFTIFGGLALFSFELLAVPKPINSTFMDTLDAQMIRKYWNRLEQDALIFDPISSRAPTVFGRYTDSNLTWYVSKPEWEALVEAPDPAAIHQAGFDYIYLDDKYWDQIGPKYQALLKQSCVHLVEEIQAKRTPEFRRLYDIRSCSNE